MRESYIVRRVLGVVRRALGLSNADGFVAPRALHHANRLFAAPVHRCLVNPINRVRYRSRGMRRLEIGPGSKTIAGFESINVVSGLDVTYVGVATRLPFRDCTFDVVYASHIIEHIPWYQAAEVVKEWARVLKRGGVLEVWTPDAFKVAKAFVAAEEHGGEDFKCEGWWRFNDDHDACAWASGRLFSYGDGSGGDHPNWHRSMYSARYLTLLFRRAGLCGVRVMNRSEVRGYDHGWINLGVVGKKQVLDTAPRARSV